ncbi:MAG: autotransporter-associated beta strand repeat-containing protein, partial [Planctomycetia bacterium]|nr:autotransporter-associated beta strand repeat-containing protein [Planctomycetia bacterium]
RTGNLPLFDQVAVINNPNNFSVELTYNANSIDVSVVAGGTIAPTASTGTIDYWTGLSISNGNWSTGANWASGVAPLPGDDLIFPAGATRLASSNDFLTAVNSITFAGNGYSVTGTVAALTLQSGITTTNAVGTNTFSIPLTLPTSETFTSTYATTSLTLSGLISMGGQTLTINGTGNMTLSGVISGAGGAIVKTGPGTATLGGANTYTGLTTVNTGVLIVTNASGLGSTAAGTIVNSGATLQASSAVTFAEPVTLNGGGVNNNPLVGSGALTNTSTATWSGPITLGSDASIGTSSGLTLTLSGGVTLAGHLLTVNSAGTATFSGALANVGPGGSVVVNGNLTAGTVNFTAANTYSGSTTVHAGTLTFSAAGTAASSSFAVDQGASLRLDNAVGANNLNRLSDTAPISLRGGTLAFLGNNAATSTETLGVITLAGGHSTISSAAGTGQTAALTATSLPRVAGATVNFSGVSLGTASNRIAITLVPAEIGNGAVTTTEGILPYATVNLDDFANYDSVTNNTIRALPAAEYFGTIAAAPAAGTGIVKLTGSETVPSSKTVTGLMLAPLAPAQLVGITTGTLTARTLAKSSAAQASSISGATLSLAGTSLTTGEGIVLVGANTLTLSSALGSTNQLIASGSGTIALPNSKTYSGGTILNSGTLTVVSG